ncbi:MAG TPA: PAS domain S-box protein [Xanthobacteraceae bacterium]|jgi:PAS domain S-box-containing protein|nr:PAS domain S-box protein [Xanthobacteraceae bacterium]
MVAKPAYGQIRLIGIAHNGRELIRVDRSGPAGSIRDVPESELQDKGGSDYFEATTRLGPGEIYVSPIDLNQEHGVIEVPHDPVMRIATPVMAPDGALFGILIVNLDMQPAFDLLGQDAGRSQQVYVVNERGDYLVNPEPAREFGFEFGKSFRWQNDFPQFAAAVGSVTQAARVTDTAAGDRIGIAMSSVRLAEGPLVSVIETLPYAALVAPAASAEDSSAMVGFFAMIGALVLAFTVARSLTRPLGELTGAVKAFSRGAAMHIPTRAGGEIGLFARTFERMIEEVKTKTAALESEVEARRRTETELKEHSARELLFGAAVRSSVDAIITKTFDGVITEWNPAAEHLFGYMTAEAVGNKIDIIVPEDRRAELDNILARIRSGELVRHHETVRQTKDGTRLDVSLSISPIKSASGEVIGACKIARDITDQKLAEVKFRLAVEACPSGMVMTERDGTIVMVNKETERLFGYAREELIGFPVEMLMPERFRPQHVRDRTQYVAKPRLRHMAIGYDFLARRKDGTEFSIEVGLNPIQTGRGLMVLSVIVDITERKRLDRLKDEFVSTVSHELRTPLTSICGSLGLLAATAGKSLPEQSQRLLAIAKSNGDRLVKLVNDILDIEKLESGRVVFKFKVIEIRPLIEQVIDANRGYADTYLIRLRAAIDSDGELWADPDRLSQALTNLISNAIKFSLPDGEVVVGVQRSGEGFRLSVRDQGEGIPAEFKPHIFEKFAQADGTSAKKTGGTGLGLSIVKEIAGRLGGEVGFADAPGGGTVFYLDLPSAGQTQARVPEIAAAAPAELKQTA